MISFREKKEGAVYKVHSNPNSIKPIVVLTTDVPIFTDIEADSMKELY